MTIILDDKIPFGTLNPMNVNQFAPGKADLDVKRYSFLSSLKDIVKERHTPDAFAGVTEYKAIVLKNLNEGQFGTSEIASIFGLNPGGAVRFIAKIPELHACLPVPKDLSDVDVLRMYPIFEGAVSLGKPNEGDIVRVTFQNTLKQLNPIYLGPLLGTANISGVNTAQSAKDAHSFGEQAGQRAAGGTNSDRANGKFDIIGCWAYSNNITDPEGLIKKMKSLGIQHVDIMLNDGSYNERTQTWPKFHLKYPQQTIIDTCKKVQAAGLSISLTSWVKADDDWISGIHNVVGPLAQKAGISQLCFDLEEPWLAFQNAKDVVSVITMSNKLLGAIRSTFTGKVAISAIVGTNYDIMDPVFKWADILIPQTYATVNNTIIRNKAGEIVRRLAPGELERIAFARYSKYGKPIVMGAMNFHLTDGPLVAYSLENQEQAIIASNNSSLALGIKEIRYWHLGFMGYESVLKPIMEFKK